MRVDYKKLGQIAVNPAYRSQPAKDTSDVLAKYLYLMSNINADVDVWSASEMAMLTNSLNRWRHYMLYLGNYPQIDNPLLMKEKKYVYYRVQS